MKHSITILDEVFDVKFSYRIVDRVQGEFEITDLNLSDASGNDLPIPGWLRELIEEELYQDDEITRAIADENQ